MICIALLRLLRIPNDHISRLNDGFSLSSGMLTNDIHPVQSDSDESQPTYIKEEIPSSIVKRKSDGCRVAELYVTLVILHFICF